jgi:hypothetical protein
VKDKSLFGGTCRCGTVSARARANHTENENEKREMRDTFRIERNALLNEQEGWFIYRDCPY